MSIEWLPECGWEGEQEALVADMGGSLKCRLVVEKGKCENTGQEEPTLSIRGLSFPGFKQRCAQSFLVVLKTPEVGICFS